MKTLVRAALILLTAVVVEAAEIRGSGDGGPLRGWKIVVEGEQMCDRPIAWLDSRLITCTSSIESSYGDAHVAGVGRLFGWRVVGGTSLPNDPAIVCSNPNTDGSKRQILCGSAKE